MAKALLFLGEMLTNWGFRAQRRRSADRAASVACRMVLNGCRMGSIKGGRL